MDTTKLRRIKKLVQTHLLKKYASVSAVGVSEKVKGGKGQERMALTVYVKRKIAAADLRDDERVDKDEELLKHISVDDIDVKEIGDIKALFAWPAVRAFIAEREQRIRPIRGGYSEGHIAITAGTGGVIVQDERGMWYRNSNNHVYADSNMANIGDPITQPGPYDGGRDPGDRAGVLAEWVPLSFGGGVNYVDAALRMLDEEELLHIEGLGEPLGVADAWIGMDVSKSGRTTGVTHGIVADIDVTIRVDYGPSGEALFEDQIMVTATGPFSQGGDSGSAVFESATMRWVGLLFAGNEQGTVTIVNHAKKVMEELRVTLVEGSGEPPPPPPPPPGDGCLGFLTRLWPFGRTTN